MTILSFRYKKIQLILYIQHNTFFVLLKRPIYKVSTSSNTNFQLTNTLEHVKMTFLFQMKLPLYQINDACSCCLVPFSLRLACSSLLFPFFLTATRSELPEDLTGCIRNQHMCAGPVPQLECKCVCYCRYKSRQLRLLLHFLYTGTQSRPWFPMKSTTSTQVGNPPWQS